MKIGLQNFQGVGAYTEIPIAPITLFYGPNSAGKSTIADAIEFLRHTLRGKTDWKKQLARHARHNLITQPLEKNYIGKPEDVAFSVTGTFNHDELSQSLWDSGISDEWFDSKHIGLKEVLFPNEMSAQFKYQIFFNHHNFVYDAGDESESWYLRESQLYMEDIPLFRVEFLDYHNSRIAFNINHPLWYKLEKQFEHGFIAACDEFMPEDYGGLSESEDAEINSASWLYFEYMVTDPFGKSPFIEDSERLVNAGKGNNPYSSESRVVAEFINLFMRLPARSVARSWDIVTIEPIRNMPNASYEFSGGKYPDHNYSWDCWVELAICIRNKRLMLDSTALDFVNHALVSPDFLDTGYSITGSVEIILDIDDAINRMAQWEHEGLLDVLVNKASRIHPCLSYQPNNLSVKIADVGVGISQVIPVVWGCYKLVSKAGVVHIQQPELHLHPKLQAQLADVFIKALHDRRNKIESTFEEYKFNDEDKKHFLKVKNACFLLESHSEHLLLRLLRRIRESNQIAKQNIYSSEHIVDINWVRSLSLTSDQVSVVYVKKDKDGLTTMKHLRLAEDGEFIDRWPDGFFTDRDVELFGEKGPFE